MQRLPNALQRHFFFFCKMAILQTVKIIQDKYIIFEKHGIFHPLVLFYQI